MIYCLYLESEVFSLTRKKVFIIVLCAVIGVFLLICALFAILRAALPTLYYRIYPFSRITGTVTVTVDGKPYSLHSDSISSVEDSYRNTPHASVNADGSARVRIRGGDKDGYSFLLHIDGVEQPIRIGTFHFNWWDVTQFDLAVSVDTSADTVTFRCAAKVIGNDGEWIPVEDSATLSLFDPELNFGFGLS